MYACTAAGSEANSSRGSGGGIVTTICYKNNPNAQGP